ncbi:MAG: hypothetical protein HYZ28_08020 [Myxococcales bacterium]|nr:hypothetical protein [Myxococcales bacterium]
MPKRNSNSGRDATMLLFEEIVRVRESLRQAERGMGAMGRYVLRMHAENKARFEALERRVAVLETSR